MNQSINQSILDRSLTNGAFVIIIQWQRRMCDHFLTSGLLHFLSKNLGARDHEAGHTESATRKTQNLPRKHPTLPKRKLTQTIHGTPRRTEAFYILHRQTVVRFAPPLPPPAPTLPPFNTPAPNSRKQPTTPPGAWAEAFFYVLTVYTVVTVVP